MTSQKAHIVSIMTGILLLALAALIASLSLGITHAYANYDIATAKGTVRTVLGPNMRDSGQVVFDHDGYDTDLVATNVKLSNKKIASVEADGAFILVTMHKKGTTTLTYNWNGKKHTVKIKGYKYRCPVKSFKVGKYQFKSQFKKYDWAEAGAVSNGKAIAGKLKVKAAKGWKIKAIYLWDKKVKNGAKVKKSTEYVIVELKNKKTKVVETITLSNANWE